MVGDERLLFNPASVWRVVIATPADWYMVSRGIHAVPSMRGGTGHTLPKATCKQRYCPGSPVASQGFTGAWSRRRALPSMNQNSRFPLKKQLFSINRIVYANRLSTVKYPYQLENARNGSSTQFPDTSQGSALQAGLSKERLLGSATFFCTYTHNQNVAPASTPRIALLSTPGKILEWMA